MLKQALVNSLIKMAKGNKELPLEIREWLRDAQINPLWEAGKHGLLWGSIGSLGMNATLAGFGTAVADKNGSTAVLRPMTDMMAWPYLDGWRQASRGEFPSHAVSPLGMGIGVPAGVGAILGGLRASYKKRMALSKLKKYDINEYDIENLTK